LTSLNLDKRGLLHRYVSRICRGLALDIDRNAYATNLFKNILMKPPTQIRHISVFQEFSPYWSPLLLHELHPFPKVPVITLGQPLPPPFRHEPTTRKQFHRDRLADCLRFVRETQLTAPERRSDGHYSA
jgi:hypothetical protein